ncbi:MAG: type I-C CRISPR-associated protein Cas5 [Oscillospiraceae bacterium]|nr:type I-C CRISPR-associated protein Cas5 [Oscillospiraceae bacterium]
MKYRNQIEFEVSGRYALFTDPFSACGGEKCSLPVPTYDALRGIADSIYRDSSMRWVVELVRIMEPVRTESMSMKRRRYFAQGYDLSVYTYLKDVRYRVRAHFEWCDGKPHDTADEHRCYRMAQRELSHGGRFEVYLGARTCPAAVRPCSVYEGEGAYDGSGRVELGFMYHGLDYGERAAPRFHRAVMNDGVIRFPPPSACIRSDNHGGDVSYALA